MAKKYIDLTGLSYAFTKIKTLVDSRVPNTRKVNGKALNADITLSASDVGASASGHGHAASEINGLATVATSGSYNDLSNKPTIPAAVTVDSALSTTSTNPVQNKVINTALEEKADSTHTHTGLATVTTSGTGAAYTATVSGITALTKGANFIMIPHTTSTSTTPTLNVNGLGAKTIQRLTSSNDYSAPGYNEGWLQSTRPVLVIYSGSYWYVQAMERPAAYDLRGTVPIASGGTGATTAEGALENLGITDLIAQATAAGLKVETGSYTGNCSTTGSYGQPSSKSLTFNGVPALVVVAVSKSSHDSLTSGKHGCAVLVPNSSSYYLSFTSKSSEIGSRQTLSSTLSDTTLTWSGNTSGINGYMYLNGTGITYNYVAITQ